GEGAFEFLAVEADGAVASGGNAQRGQRIEVRTGPLDRTAQRGAQAALHKIDAVVARQQPSARAVCCIGGSELFDDADEGVVAVDKALDGALDASLVLADRQCAGGGLRRVAAFFQYRQADAGY